MFTYLKWAINMFGFWLILVEPEDNANLDFISFEIYAF